MSDRGKRTKVVDSFVTLRAAQRRAQDGPSSPPSSTPPPERTIKKPDSGPRKPGTHIGRTVLPSKYEVVCYDCDFEFTITGKAKSTHCPKCRQLLDLTDHTITGTFTDKLVTAGRVTLSRTAVLEGGRITANDVKLEGTVKEGQLKVQHTLELAAGAAIPEDLVQARNLRVAAGASYTFRKKVTFRTVDVFGALRANLWAEGLVTVHPGGHLKGKLNTVHFCVLEGGGLSADVVVGPRKKEPEPPATPETLPSPEEKE